MSSPVWSWRRVPNEFHTAGQRAHKRHMKRRIFVLDCRFCRDCGDCR